MKFIKWLKGDPNSDFQVKLRKSAAKDKSWLATKSSVSDIFRLPKWYQIFLILVFILIMFLNFYDINGYKGNHFAPTVQYQMVIDKGLDPVNGPHVNSLFGYGKSGAITITVLYSLNGLAAITGLLSSAFMTFGFTSQFFWGWINAIIFGVFSLTISAFGDFIYQMLRVGGSFYGWYVFVYKDLVNRKQVDESKSKKQRINFWLMIVAACAFSILMWYFAMTGIGYVAQDNSIAVVGGAEAAKHAAHYELAGEYTRALDGVVNGISFVAYFMQVMNMGEQFWLWNVQIFPRMFKYIGIPGTGAVTVPNLLIQFIFYFIMNCIGLYEKLFKDKIEAKKLAKKGLNIAQIDAQMNKQKLTHPNNNDEA